VRAAGTALLCILWLVDLPDYNASPIYVPYKSEFIASRQVLIDPVRELVQL